jgi:hypothetical protein
MDQELAHTSIECGPRGIVARREQRDFPSPSKLEAIVADFRDTERISPRKIDYFSGIKGFA